MKNALRATGISPCTKNTVPGKRVALPPPLRSIPDREKTQVMGLPPEGCVDPKIYEVFQRSAEARRGLERRLAEAELQTAGAHSRLDKHRDDLRRHGSEIVAHGRRLDQLEQDRVTNGRVFDAIGRKVVRPLKALTADHTETRQRLLALERQMAGLRSFLEPKGVSLKPVAAPHQKRHLDWVIPVTGIVSAGLFICLVVGQLL